MDGMERVSRRTGKGDKSSSFVAATINRRRQPSLLRDCRHIPRHSYRRPVSVLDRDLHKLCCLSIPYNRACALAPSFLRSSSSSSSSSSIFLLSHRLSFLSLFPITLSSRPRCPRASSRCRSDHLFWSPAGVVAICFHPWLGPCLAVCPLKEPVVSASRYRW